MRKLHTIREIAVEYGGWMTSKAMLRARLSLVHNLLTPLDRLEQAKATASFERGMEVAVADGAEDDSFVILYKTTLYNTFEDAFSAALVAAALMLWAESKGALSGLDYDVPLPFQSKDYDPDVLFDIELDKLAEALDSGLDLPMTSMADVEVYRDWFGHRVHDDYLIMTPVLYAVRTLCTLSTLLESVGSVTSVVDMVSRRVAYEKGWE